MLEIASGLTPGFIGAVIGNKQVATDDRCWRETAIIMFNLANQRSIVKVN